MGVVWAATNEATSREVALKLLVRSEPELRSRLLREALACGALKHPNIIDVYDIAQTDAGEPFLVMELLSGETLAQVLEARRRLDVPEAARVAQQVVRALDAAHALGIVYRDLKPANVFLHEVPGAEEQGLKVLDFGVAKRLSADDALGTVLGGVVGSPAYMSPEQARGDCDIDPRSDIWSLGVVLFEMVTGVRPFTGEPQQILEKLARGPIPAISDRIRNANPRIVDIVSRCLQRDRRDRPGSAAEISELLEPLRRREISETSASAAMAAFGPVSAPVPAPIHDPLSSRMPSIPEMAFAEAPASIFGAASPGIGRPPAPSAPSGAELLGSVGIVPQWGGSTGIPFPIEGPQPIPYEPTQVLEPAPASAASAGSLTAPLFRDLPDDATVPPIESRTQAAIGPAKTATEGRSFRRIGLIAGVVGAVSLLSAIFYLAVVRRPAEHAANTASVAATVALQAVASPSAPEPSAESAAGAAPIIEAPPDAQPTPTAQAALTAATPTAAELATTAPTTATPPAAAPTTAAPATQGPLPPPVLIASSPPAARGVPTIDRRNPFTPAPPKKRCVFLDDKGNPCPKYHPSAP